MKGKATLVSVGKSTTRKAFLGASGPQPMLEEMDSFLLAIMSYLLFDLKTLIGRS